MMALMALMAQQQQCGCSGGVVGSSNYLLPTSARFGTSEVGRMDEVKEAQCVRASCSASVVVERHQSTVR